MIFMYYNIINANYKNLLYINNINANYKNYYKCDLYMHIIKFIISWYYKWKFHNLLFINNIILIIL
jgi:hypothetical protein